MKTKLNLIIAAAALIGLASCEKRVPAAANAADGDDAEYVIVIDGGDATKAAASRSLDLADLVGNSTGTFTATLMKRVRGTEDFDPVDFQPDWSWSKDSEAFSGSQDAWEPNKYGFAAQAAGSGNVSISASYGGNALASSSATVTVTDSRSIAWSDSTTVVTSGVIYYAVLNRNYSGTVTLSSDNGSLLIGESTESLSSTASVTFSESTGTEKIIYYKYTGPAEPAEPTIHVYASPAAERDLVLTVKNITTLAGAELTYEGCLSKDTYRYTLTVPRRGADLSPIFTDGTIPGVTVAAWGYRGAVDGIAFFPFESIFTNSTWRSYVTIENTSLTFFTYSVTVYADWDSKDRSSNQDGKRYASVLNNIFVYITDMVTGEVYIAKYVDPVK